LLRGAAVSAGVVWSAPTIKTVRALAATGSPGPYAATKSSSAEMFGFAGTFPSTRRTVDGTLPNCSAFSTFTFHAPLEGLGDCRGHVEFCAVAGATLQVSHATLTLRTDDGSVDGTASSGQVTEQPGQNFSSLHIEFDLVDGTRRYHRAAGHATLDADLFDSDPANLRVSGTVTGNFATS
jgi:hypothetical protein